MMFKRPWLLKQKLHTRKTAPPTCPNIAALKTALQDLLMCMKYHPWHKCYWQTWLDVWGSELPVYLMYIHLLYPTGLARAPKLCHLATLQLPPKCIVTLIMQISILFSPNTCIRSLLLYWGWDMGLTDRNQLEFFFFIICRNLKFLGFLHFITVVTFRGDQMRNMLWCSGICNKSFARFKRD